MFKISVVTKEEMNDFIAYMGYESKGMMLVCREETGITGGICFDLIDGGAYIEKVKAEKEEMLEIIIKAALNFLDLNNIYDVYAEKTDEKIYKLLGFKESGNKIHLNIFGYFGKGHNHG